MEHTLHGPPDRSSESETDLRMEQAAAAFRWLCWQRFVWLGLGAACAAAALWTWLAR